MTFADQMVAKYQALLLANAGVERFEVDGSAMRYVDLEKQYAFWRRLAQRESGARPLAAQIKLGGDLLV
jgi:hypothetical protein